MHRLNRRDVIPENSARMMQTSGALNFLQNERILSMGTHLTLTASDDHKFDAYRVDPAGTPKGGIVVIQELFGVNRHIRSVADRFAALAYFASSPALFDRIERVFESGYSPEEVQAARRFVANPPMQAWILDIAAAREAIAD